MVTQQTSSADDDRKQVENLGIMTMLMEKISAAYMLHNLCPYDANILTVTSSISEGKQKPMTAAYHAVA